MSGATESSQDNTVSLNAMKSLRRCHILLMLFFYSDFTDGPVGQPKIETNATDPIPCTDVVLTCHHESVSANPVVNKVNWTKDGVSLERNEKNFQYIVRNVDKKDNGSYRCSVGNDIGYSRVSENITLTVNFSAFCK